MLAKWYTSGDKLSPKRASKKVGQLPNFCSGARVCAQVLIQVGISTAKRCCFQKTPQPQPTPILTQSKSGHLSLYVCSITTAIT